MLPPYPVTAPLPPSRPDPHGLSRGARSPEEGSSKATQQRNQSGLRPAQLLTNEDYHRLMRKYNAAKPPAGAPAPLRRMKPESYQGNVVAGGSATGATTYTTAGQRREEMTR